MLNTAKSVVCPKNLKRNNSGYHTSSANYISTNGTYSAAQHFKRTLQSNYPKKLINIDISLFNEYLTDHDMLGFIVVVDLIKLTMIKAILVFNNHGKPRLLKFYQYYPEEEQQQIVRETFQLVSKRDDNVCNFLEGGSLIGGSDYKLIYRHYATLYFVFCVDSSESELGILDLIQVLVETLDRCFENVCELDLIFHVDKVHFILSELVMGGMVLETNMNEILTRIQEQDKIEKQEAGLSAAPGRAVAAMKNMNISQQIKDMRLSDLPSLGNFKF